MATLEQEVIEKIKALSPEKQQEVLRFVEGLMPPPEKTLLEEIREIYQDVPEEEWDKLPPDGSENLDHYLYGAPKK